MEFPKYQSHKTVGALRIASIQVNEDGGKTLHFDGTDETITLSAESLSQKPCPEQGMYLIEYEDGYTSFSPSKAFEEGYTLKSSDDGQDVIDDGADGDGAAEEATAQDDKPARPLSRVEKTAAFNQHMRSKGAQVALGGPATGPNAAPDSAIRPKAPNLKPTASGSGPVIAPNGKTPDSTSEARPDALQKTSGDDQDAGDWTQAGQDASGFPVPKGSLTDVTGSREITTAATADEAK